MDHVTGKSNRVSRKVKDYINDLVDKAFDDDDDAIDKLNEIRNYRPRDYEESPRKQQRKSYLARVLFKDKDLKDLLNEYE